MWHLVAGRHGNRAVTESVHPDLQVGVRERDWTLRGVFEASKPSPLIHFLQLSHTSSSFPNSIPTDYQAFKNVSLCECILIQTTTSLIDKILQPKKHAMVFKTGKKMQDQSSMVALVFNYSNHETNAGGHL